MPRPNLAPHDDYFVVHRYPFGDRCAKASLEEEQSS